MVTVDSSFDDLVRKHHMSDPMVFLKAAVNYVSRKASPEVRPHVESLYSFEYSLPSHVICIRGALIHHQCVSITSKSRSVADNMVIHSYFPN